MRVKVGQEFFFSDEVIGDVPTPIHSLHFSLRNESCDFLQLFVEVYRSLELVCLVSSNKETVQSCLWTILEHDERGKCECLPQFLVQVPLNAHSAHLLFLERSHLVAYFRL